MESLPLRHRDFVGAKACLIVNRHREAIAVADLQPGPLAAVAVDLADLDDR